MASYEEVVKVATTFIDKEQEARLRANIEAVESLRQFFIKMNPSLRSEDPTGQEIGGVKAFDNTEFNAFVEGFLIAKGVSIVDAMMMSSTMRYNFQYWEREWEV